MVISLELSQFDHSQLGLFPLEESGRKVLKYSQSETFAYIPSALLNIQENSKNLRLPVEKLVQFRTVTLKHLRSFEEDIENHAEQRIQLFFQQLLFFYGLGTTLKSGRTDMQIGRGNKDYAAAHSSTLPSLLSQKNDQVVVFGKGSSFYLMQNATVLLPVAVNKIDTQLDLQHRSLKTTEAMRTIALRILNRVASQAAPLDPKSGLREFIKQFLNLVNKAQHLRLIKFMGAERACEKEWIAQDLFILDCYKRVFGSYLQKLEESDDLVKLLALAYRAPEVNRDFYLTIQAEMLKTLISERHEQSMIRRESPRRPKPSRCLLLLLHWQTKPQKCIAG